MKRKKFLTIFGTRPQYVKVAELSRIFPMVLVHTGQHYYKCMKDIFFKGLKIRKPDYDLAEQDFGRMVTKIEKVVDKEKPDYIIVYGDTRSTYAGALVAYYKNIKLIHIEAGCRSFNDDMVEERIRKFVDDVSFVHFAPSEENAERLKVNRNRLYVYNVGATQLDTIMHKVVPTKKPKDAYKYSVMTLHRAENMDKSILENIFNGLSIDKKIEFYAHPNTDNKLKEFGIKVPKNIILKKPIGYKEMINRVAFADKVITDSGGLQVEAFFLRRPCLTLRNETEWMETVESGWNRLVGFDKEKIRSAMDGEWRGDHTHTCYGVGDANEKIKIILQSL